MVGDVGLDRYTIGTVERISPEAPVPIVLVEDEQYKLGLASNVADNVQALGGVSLLLGVVGDDRIVLDFKRLLRAARISPKHLVTDPKRRTVLKERIVSDRQQLLRVDYETVGPLTDGVSELIQKTFQKLLADCDYVVLEDYHKGLLSQDVAFALIESARKAGKAVAVDPKSKTPAEWYRGASLSRRIRKKPKRFRACRFVTMTLWRRRAFGFSRVTSAEHVVITRGKEGMAIFSSGSRTIRLIPTYAREVYDVSGAGDTVIAVLALALAGGARSKKPPYSAISRLASRSASAGPRPSRPKRWSRSRILRQRGRGSFCGQSRLLETLTFPLSSLYITPGFCSIMTRLSIA